MVYEVIIIWAWASWLFAWINLDKKLKKIILEKTTKPWQKVLLSWWERANVSNMDIDIEADYFTQNKRFLHSIFSKFTNWDMMDFFSKNNIEIIEEDRSRMILKSWNSKELLNCLLWNLEKNDCKIKYNQDVKKIKKLENWNYEIKTDSWEKYISQNIIISSWWKSFSHLWTTWEWYKIASDLWIKVIETYRCLCAMSTKKDLSDISWISHNLLIELKDIQNNKKNIYSEKWPLLFTHFWISWPIVHNLSNAIWEYLNSLKIKSDCFEKYILDNLSVDLTFDFENIPKRLIKFFSLNDEDKNSPQSQPFPQWEKGVKELWWESFLKINLELQNWRSWKEAKVTWWWIDTWELDNNMQSKKYKWLYFVWETVDVTWKTWGFNLQWSWSSAYVASMDVNKKK